MFGYYSAPSHFNQYHHSSYPSSRSSYYHQPSAPHASCSQQYHRGPRQYYVEDSDDDEEDSSATYYEYLDAARRQQERRELLEAQARRRAQEERAIQQARARAHAEKLQAERRAEQIRQEREYRVYVERQLEARRQAQLRAQQIQRQQELEQEQELERQRKIRQHHQQQRRPHQFDEEDFARAIFGQLGWQPLTQHAKERSASPSAPVKPVGHAAHASQEPAVKPLPAPAHVQTQQRQQPKMSYMAAVTLIQSLAKEQISIRQRLRDLHRISSEFSTLKDSFVFPESLVFDLDKSTADSPVLAYTSQNLPLRAQEESLTRLLTKLDAVPSNGSERVKSERKVLARAIQAELDRLDAEKMDQWKKQRTAAEMVISEITPVAKEDVHMSEQQQEEEEIQESVTSSVPEKQEPDAAMTAEHTDQAGEKVSSTSTSATTEPLVQMEVDQSPVPLPAAAAEDEVQHTEVSSPISVSVAEVSPPEHSTPSTEPSNGAAGTTPTTTELAPEPTSDQKEPITTDPIQAEPSASTAQQQQQQQQQAQPSSASQIEPQAEEDPTPQESTSSVSATLLPATHGLGLLEVVSQPAEADRADAESDSGSDTSFEML